MSEWVVPGYTELKELGAGGFGSVVLARHDATGTPVAIKYLRSDLVSDPYVAEMFRAEAITLGSLDDPHVTRLYEYVEGPDGAAIVMELVDGITLREILTRYGKTSPEAALVVLYGSLLGLAAAHARGVVHRDYKPANVLVNAHGASKLTDFGIAVLAGTDLPTGATAAYAPPEQWDAAPATPASDVYAATVTFYECLTGQRPFTGQSDTTLAEQHRHGSVPMEPVPQPLRTLVARGMAKDPQYRPADAAELAAELRVVAASTYGQDWEQRGHSQLGQAALLLAALWPTAGVPALQGTTIEQVRLSQGSHGAQGAHGAQGSQESPAHAASQGSGSQSASRAELHRDHLSHVRHEEHLQHLRYLSEHAVNRAGAVRRASRIGSVARAAGVVVTAATVAVAIGTVAATAHTRSSAGGGAGRPAAITAYRESVAPGAATAGSAPTLAYTTATAIMIRTGDAAPRVLTSAPPSAYGGLSDLAWSADGKQIAWLTNGKLEVATVSGGPVRSWSCSCEGVAFQGARVLTVSTDAAGGELTTAVPQLLAFSAGRAAPVTESVTGITTAGSDTDFELLAGAAGNSLIVAYGDAGGSDLGGPQTLYRVNAAGQATVLTGSKSGKASGEIGDVTSDQAGDQIGFITESRGGACGYYTQAFVLNTSTGTMTSPAFPTGGGPGGFLVEGLWFDQAGSAHAAAIPNPADCATSNNPPAFPAHSTLMDYQAQSARWVQTGAGVLHAEHAPDGWQAQLTGTIDDSSVTGFRLTLSHGTTTTTVAGVTSFAWSPAT